MGKKVPSELEELENELRQTQRQAFSEGTIKNLLSQWRAFYAFCHIYSMKIWPVTVHVLCLFAQFLSFNMKAPSTIVNYLSGLRTLHFLCNAKPPNIEEFEYRITVRGLKRRMKHTPRQAMPMTPLLLGQIYSILNFRRRIDIVFWATIVLGFFMMLRASNLVPKSVKKFSQLRQLTKSAIIFNKKGMVAKIKWSKTIQFRQKVLDVPIFAIPNSILCPVKAIKRVLYINKANKHGPLLAISDSKIFTYNMLQSKLRQVAKILDIKKSKLTTHSMRRGGVAWAHRNGIPESLIKLYGDWSSDAFKQYLSFPLEMRVAVGARMARRLQNFKNLF